MAKLMANADFMRFSLGVYTREQTAAFVEKLLGWQRAKKPSLFAVILRSAESKSEKSGALLGYCGLYHQHIDGIDEIEIGYRMHTDYWNKGLTTEAAMAVRDHAFRDLKLARVISLISPENIPSQRVAEKVGMTFEKLTIYRELQTQVFALSRERWLTMNAA
jgi:ribosomal-protein-alanine N-acetyltransferase